MTGSTGRHLRAALTAFMLVFSSSLASIGAAGAASPNAASPVDYAQCANDKPPSTATSCTQQWINGILNANNSHYREDEVTPQRLEVLIPSGLSTTHSVEISYLARKANNHAYDSLATWNYTATTADRCAQLNPSDCVEPGQNAPDSVFGIPDDPTAVPTCAPGGCSDVVAGHMLPAGAARQMWMFGGTLTGITAPTYDGNVSTAGTDTYASVTVSFTVPGTNGKTTVDQKVQLLFGGHLAAESGPRGWGTGLGSASINGGPYHIKWIALDNSSVGNRDNQIMSGAILGPSSLLTQAQSSTNGGGTWGNLADQGTTPAGSSVRDTATISDTSATGTVTYRLYTGTLCDSNGAPTGTLVSGFGTNGASAVTISSGVIPPSASYVPAVGDYQFIASYGGDSSHAPSASACGTERFTVTKLSPSISTQVKNDSASGASLANGAHIAIGTIVHDTATLSGATAGAGGTVTYSLYNSAGCTSGAPNGSLVASFGTSGSASEPVSSGTVTASPTFTASSAGGYQFIAVYSGDGSNNGASSACGTETFVVDPNPTSTTTQVQVMNQNGTSWSNVTNGQGLTFGSTVRDTATLSGLTPNAGGTVTYHLYSGTGCSSNTPTGQAVAGWPAVSGSNTVGLSAGQPGPSPAFEATQAGGYQFIVSYSGDANNSPSTSACGSETFVINPAVAQITTVVQSVTAGPNYTPVANGGHVAIGTTVRDTASLSNDTVNAGGTVTYTLYSGTSCLNGAPTGSVVSGFGTNGSYTASVSNGVAGASTTFTVTQAGGYQFIVSYSGDGNNQPATSSCGSETFNVDPNATSLTTQAQTVSGQTTSNLPNGGHVSIGTVVRDTSALSGKTAGAGGTVTYQLFSGSACSNNAPTGSLVAAFGSSGSSVASVSSGTPGASATFTVSQAGDYQFIATYSGDSNNSGSTSACGSETFTVDPNPTTISTQVETVSGQTVAGLVNGGSIAIGTSVHDTALLHGFTSDAGGTVTYQLFNGTSCTNNAPDGSLVTAFGSNGSSVVAVSGGAAGASASFLVTQAGGYQFIAHYSGDGNNVASTSACGSETFTVLPNNPGISTTVEMLNGNGTWVAVPNTGVAIGTSIHDTATLSNATANAGGTVTYRLYSGTTCGTNGAPTGALVSAFGSNGASVQTVSGGIVPASDSLTMLSAGGYQFIATYSGDNNNSGTTSTCGSEAFTVLPNSTTTSTQVQTVSGQSTTDLANGGKVGIGTVLRDTAVLGGATSGASGTVTYRLYSGSACTDNAPTGTLVAAFGTAGASTAAVSQGIAGPSATFTATQAGDYQFIASYGGDGNNQPSTSPCGTETFTVDPNNTSLTTQVQTVSGQTATNLANGGHVSIGTVVRDTSALSGKTASAGGTVTYQLFSGSTCTNNAPTGSLVAAFGNSGASVANVSSGSPAASASFTLSQAGDYQFIATYGGDSNNNGSTSACGSETFTVDKAATSIATTPSAASGNVGISVHDTATVSGGSQPGGSVTFALYGPGDSTCTNNLIAKLSTTEQSKFVNVALVNGTATSGDYTTTDVGVYQWVATYSGDTNNLGSNGTCGDTSEQVVTAAVLAEVSLPPTGSVALALLLSGLPLLALGSLLLLLGRRRRREGGA